MTDDQSQQLPSEFFQKMERVNSLFRSMNLRADQFSHPREQKTDSLVQNKKVHNFNSRGEIMLSPKEIKQNYKNAIYGFKWYQMPLCRRSIYKKVVFWVPASVILTYTYAEYIKQKSQNSKLILAPKFYVRSYLVILSITTVICFAESLLTDQFCDIQSPFYEEKQSRLELAKNLKKKMDRSDDGFFKSFFK